MRQKTEKRRSRKHPFLLRTMKPCWENLEKMRTTDVQSEHGGSNDEILKQSTSSSLGEGNDRREKRISLERVGFYGNATNTRSNIPGYVSREPIPNVDGLSVSEVQENFKW